MKSEVGMYCYNKTNRQLGIGKIISFQNNNNVNIKYKNDIELVSIGNVIASFNVIDILEAGDYVNGDRVNGVVINEFSSYVILEGVGHYVEDLETVEAKDIETIVTKEQFEQMAYKVGE